MGQLQKLNRGETQMGRKVEMIPQVTLTCDGCPKDKCKAPDTIDENKPLHWFDPETGEPMVGFYCEPTLKAKASAKKALTDTGEVDGEKVKEIAERRSDELTAARQAAVREYIASQPKPSNGGSDPRMAKITAMGREWAKKYKEEIGVEVKDRGKFPTEVMNMLLLANPLLSDWQVGMPVPTLNPPIRMEEPPTIPNLETGAGSADAPVMDKPQESEDKEPAPVA